MNNAKKKKSLFDRLQLRWQWDLYLIFLIPLAWYILFCYAPMYGVLMAFKDYKMTGGFWGIITSPWAGFDHFTRFFSGQKFGQVMWNTISISLYSFAVNTPIPILLALMLSEVRGKFFKKAVQMSTYAPHFLSTVVVVGMLYTFLSPTSGFVNGIITSLGGKAVNFMGRADMFQPLYVWSGTWQSMGWNSIIYMAAIASVSPELIEAAMIDGASRLRRIWHVTIPCILPTIVILMILNSGHLMSVGFEKVFLMQTPLNTTTSEVVSTYTYKMGIREYEYSYSTAIGLFNSVISFTMLIIVNTIARKVSEYSLW
jgi:putative aldouronate transport system permease protein